MRNRPSPNNRALGNGDAVLKITFAELAPFLFPRAIQLTIRHETCGRGPGTSPRFVC
jgi:hypothetical protein